MRKNLRLGIYIIGLFFSLFWFLFLGTRFLSFVYQTRAGIQIERVLSKEKEIPPDRFICKKRPATQFKQENFTAAVANLQKSIKYDNRNEQAFQMLGMIYCNLNDYQNAIQSFINYTNLRPDNPLGHLKLGFAYEAAEQDGAAIEQWELAGITDRDFVELGKNEQAEGQASLAIDWYQRALLLDSNSYKAWLGLGKCFEELHGSEQALQYYWEAWYLDREHSTSNISLALMNQGEFQTVESLLHQALNEYPHSSERETWWQYLAKAYEERGLVDRAIDIYKSAMAEFPSNASLHIFLGWNYYERDGNSKLAIKEFKQAIELNDKSADGYYAMGQILSKDGKYEQADDWYAQAIQRNSERSWYYVSRANNIRNLGDYKFAIDLYQEALDRSPDCSSCYLNLAIAYRLSNQPHEALLAIQEALSLENHPDEIYLITAGEIYEWLKDYGKAREVFQKAFILNPNNKAAIDGLGRVKIK
jgi:tetratricopeptide (TPR) repeat protein